jgi:hypothetical protein
MTAQPTPYARMRGRMPRALAPGAGLTCAEATPSHTSLSPRAVDR